MILFFFDVMRHVMALIPEFFMEAVLSIGVRNSDGTVRWIGTGFFAAKELACGKSAVFLITNRHVFEGQKSVVIRLKEKGSGKLREQDLPLEDDTGKLLYSVGQETGADIAVRLMESGLLEKQNLNLSYFDFDAHTMTSEKFIKMQGGAAGSLVYMLGFPMALVETDKNNPICRMGCVARMDQPEISESGNFLLDIQNFPGNSGSPIVSRPEMISLEGSESLDETVLIGIVHGYFQYEESQQQNTKTKKIVEIKSENSGIALANPVEYIMRTAETEVMRVFGPDFWKKYNGNKRISGETESPQK